MTDTETSLCAEYEAWLTANGVEDAGSADELLCERGYDDNEKPLTMAQRRWLADFIERWEEMRDAEDRNN